MVAAPLESTVNSVVPAERLRAADLAARLLLRVRVAKYLPPATHLNQRDTIKTVLKHVSIIKVLRLLLQLPHMVLAVELSPKSPAIHDVKMFRGFAVPVRYGRNSAASPRSRSTSH